MTQPVKLAAPSGQVRTCAPAILSQAIGPVERRGRALAFSQSPILEKFRFALPGLGPTGIPLATKHTATIGGTVVDFYALEVTEFAQQIAGLPKPTTLRGYGDLNGQHRYLGGVVVATRRTPVLFSVTNRLPDTAIVPTDPTLDAGPGLTVGDLPLNRIAVHLHGGFTPWISDGTPFQWFTPHGRTGPSFANVPGTHPPSGTATYFYPMDQSARFVWYHDHAIGVTRINAYTGIASGVVLTDDFEQLLLSSGLLPDLVGIPLIIQDKTFFDAANDPNYPIAHAVSGGSLWYPWEYEANSLPNGKGRWDYGPDVTPPAAVIAPLPRINIVPEFFADTAMVNGQPYPVVNVTEGTFRFRLLNGSQARFWHLNLYEESATAPGEADKTKPGPALYQFGTEGGFLPSVAMHPNGIPIPLDPTDPTGNTADPAGPFNLLLGPAERAEVLIDFTGFAGCSLILFNDAPAPFPGGDPRNDYFTGDPDFTNPANNPFGLSGGAPSTLEGQGPNTRTIMKIVVGAGTNGFALAGKLAALDDALKKNFTGGNSVPPQQPPLLYQGPDAATPGPVPYTGPVHRRLTLNEDFDQFGRLIQREGTFTSKSLNSQDLATWALPYISPPTETPMVGATEVWEIYNLTGDTHPIHFHLVNVQIIQRAPFTGAPDTGVTIGTPRGPDANEVGWKETVRMNPGEVITVITRFDLPKVPFPVEPSARDAINGNEYVWHCHILEHEEHDMMRPLVVLGPLPLAVVPETEKISKHGTAQFTIVNGVPPYRIASSNRDAPPHPSKVNQNGGTFTASPDRTTTYTITDHAGTQVTATVIVEGHGDDQGDDDGNH
jgi:spore coat protein A